ncbi:Heat shock transcription factor [Malassezia vespertilionis]|uniref:Hsf1p n=1 Tax=Malassezia vespertilionis TaxID=2020962 RepID=A0A2N1JD66_9BASI|nr:Heat shock transcription factor [Malassezia vespertilionis]PKI84495.1 Hsf1p [Malassezia vespertilionis]WFD06592.1 Heat shock transcription factor [Malassezia vespertilionis]
MSIPGQSFRPDILSPSDAHVGQTSGDIPHPTVMNRSNPAFLNKLRSMVDDPNTDELIRWSPNGDTFLVPNHVRFGNEVLPRFFKHNNFSSFVRQLNMYGFHKVPHLQQGALKHDQPLHHELWEFSNPCFHRDQPELLSKVQRKRSGKEKDQSADEKGILNHFQSNALTHGDMGKLLTDGSDVSRNTISPVQLANVMNALQSVRNNQRTIIDEISQLQHSSQALWQQGMENRQQTLRQQDTINRILQFMGSVFGSSNVGDMLHADGAVLGIPGGLERGMPNNFHSFANADPQMNNIKRNTPTRPQKRARLLIQDANHALHGNGESTNAMQVDTSKDETLDNIKAYTEADEGTSSQNSWTGITEKSSPKSRVSSPKTAQPNSTTLPNSISPESSQALLNAITAGDRANAWANNVNNSGFNNATRLDPQLLSALQTTYPEASDSNTNSTQDMPDMGALWAYGPNNANMPPNQVGNAIPNANTLPEERFARGVQQVNADVQANMDQTAKLQTTINALVSKLRFDNDHAEDSEMPNILTTQPMAGMDGSGTAVDANPLNFMTSGPATQGSPVPSEFDLDTFLNQFVDPMSSPGGTVPFGHTPSPAPTQHDNNAEADSVQSAVSVEKAT